MNDNRENTENSSEQQKNSIDSYEAPVIQQAGSLTKIARMGS